MNGETHLFRETMNAIEKRLDSRFVRIHRSHIVNADRIKELLPNDGEHTVVLQRRAPDPEPRLQGPAAGAPGGGTGHVRFVMHDARRAVAAVARRQ